MATRLKQIKLSGFKSFVDPTSLSLPSNLIGIVGPNGCGKSNIIDAVRWVMGELSAKQLRAESSTDVIFKGSSDRKPVGQASIELVFDNAEGKLGGGQYAAYNQIAIRREVNRDGVSNYYLNGNVCRRRDIVDVFSGTGLGPRSYAIIGQDMISRFIEAKPEELRAYLEDVAGISKYKERRRETETRIRHTRENLSRIMDLCEELGKQLERLQRQAKAAEKYKIYKEEEKVLKAQQLALRWTTLDTEIQHFKVAIQEHETELEACKSERQHIDTEIEKSQQIKTDLNDEFQEVQGRYYEIGSEISRIEQAIEHQKERHQQLEMDLQQLEESWQDTANSLQEDKEKISELNSSIAELEPQVISARQIAEQSLEVLKQAEEAMQAWQAEWDAFNEQCAQVSQMAEVQQARIQHLEQQKMQAQQRLSKLDQEKTTLSNDDQVPSDLDRLVQEVEEARLVTNEKRTQLTELINKLDEQQTTHQEISEHLDNLRRDLRKKRETEISLEAQQQIALGQDDVSIVNWLEHHGLHDRPRLAQAMKVDKGWEKAVEVVLGSYLEAVCVDGLDMNSSLLEAFDQGSVTLLDTQIASKQSEPSPRTLLSSKVRSSCPVNALLQKVYAVDSFNEARELRHQLNSDESVITQDGIWFGPHWLRISKGESRTSGIVEREQALRDIHDAMIAQEKLVAETENSLQMSKTVLTQLQNQRDVVKDELAQSDTQYAKLNAKLQVIQSQADQIRRRNVRLNEEFEEQNIQIEQATQALAEAKQLWETASHEMEQNSEKRALLLQKREENHTRLLNAKEQAQLDRDQLHEFELQLELSVNKVSSLQQSIDRMERQIATLQNRRDQLNADLSDDSVPVEQLEAELKVALEKRISIEQKLADARQKVETIDTAIQTLNANRHQAEEAVNQARTLLENKRLESQEFKIRQTTLSEQLAEAAFDLETVLSTLPEEATEATWMEKLEAIAARISRLGAINLAAIEEYDQSAERKEYLDKQRADLEEALNTLQNAIRKIDRETRSRFKETFDSVNERFKTLFPKIFGGGHAYLELTGDDLLDTGVTLMARPPGKKIANIHLLSGGEKALTAISLVFSIFQLQPAPFCMLDEVDAPLDDANVGRFCDLVKEMSKTVQFIFISHNKNAIAMGNHLMGVTMHEPGVSRIVAVDVEAAVSMVEEA